MRFMVPELLWLILALPPLGLAGWAAAMRRRKALQRFAGGPEMLARFSGEVSVHRRLAKVLLLHLALLGLILAAARPQWGTRLEAITRRGVDVVILLDTSLSMAAADMAPSRLGQARHEVATLLEGLAGNRVALVTFAGQATLSCPLTLDHSAVRLNLETVEVETVQIPGTALADALRLGLRAFGKEQATGDERSRALILFTDGEDHEGGIDEVIGALTDAGVTLFAVGTGTTRGAPIPVADASGVSTGYKKDREGKVVTTRLDETVLEQLALGSGGRYYRATASEAEVDEIARALEGMDATEFGSVLRARYEERFQIPLIVALLALFVETMLGDRRRVSVSASSGEVTG